MISLLMNVILTFVSDIVNIILTPFDLLISNYLPNINSLLTMINDFIDILLSYVPFVIDLSLLPRSVVAIVVHYLVAKVIITLSSYVIKTAIKWYMALRA